ncbi:hypothetical protein pb186bvf_015976 [Paramecium bursaria]
MNDHICKCGLVEVELICISLRCNKNKRFCCQLCATDKYMNQEQFILKFQQDSKELLEDRNQVISYLFNSFKSLYQQQLFISNEQKEEVYELFKETLEYQQKLNQQTNQTFQMIYNKIKQKDGFINLSIKQIKSILMIRVLQHDNDQLGQILFKLQNILQLRSSFLLINLRLVGINAIPILTFKKQMQPTNLGLKIGKNIFAEDDIVFWTNYKYVVLQGQILFQTIIDSITPSTIINIMGQIKNMLITHKYIFCTVFRSDFTNQCSGRFIFQILFKINGQNFCQFTIILLDLVIINQYDKGKLILFCYKNKKIINIIRKQTKIINYITISNQLVMIENKSLNFYNINSKRLRNSISLTLLEGKYEYIVDKQDLITCKDQLTIQKIDLKQQSSSIIKTLDNIFSYVYNLQYNYLIIFTQDNDIIIFDPNYFLIKRINEFIVTKDMKYIFFRKSNAEDQIILRIYRCQIDLKHIYLYQFFYILNNKNSLFFPLAAFKTIYQVNFSQRMKIIINE